MAANPASYSGGIAYEPIDKSQDSLTQYLRSVENLAGQQGQKALSGGLSQTQSGIAAAAPSLDYLTKLVKGDQADVAQATQPETDQIRQQFSQIRNILATQPRGGGKASAMAEAPFQEAGNVSRMQSQARTGAAGQLGGLATQLAGLGISEGQLGLGLEGLGLQSGLERRGQNLQERGQDLGFISNIISAVV